MSTEIEAAFAETLAAHLQLNAEALRMLDGSRRMHARTFKNPTARETVIEGLRHQMVTEAFDVGLGILACTDVLYRVHAYLGVRYEDEKAPASDRPWRSIVPELSELDDQSVVELRIEAIGAPVLLREA